MEKNIKTSLKEFLKEQKLNEISSDTFKSAINISKERNLNRRTENLGKLFFREFIGKEIFEDGIIKDIVIAAYKGDSRNLVAIDIEHTNKNEPYHYQDARFPKSRWLNYDIDNDNYLDLNRPIERKDSRLLGKIAQKINPDTKYKQTGIHFNIKGWE